MFYIMGGLAIIPSRSLTENPVEMQKMPPYYVRLEANLTLAEILE